MLRRICTGLAFVVGVVGSIATGEPAADVSGQSDSQSVVLNADAPSSEIAATADLALDAEATVTGGEIAVNVSADEGVGSVTVTLRSSSGQETSVDIVDTESQGATRIGIDAFAGCVTACGEDLTVIFDRTDTELVGDLGLTWSLEGLASTDVAASGSIDFNVP